MHSQDESGEVEHEAMLAKYRGRKMMRTAKQSLGFFILTIAAVAFVTVLLMSAGISMQQALQVSASVALFAWVVVLGILLCSD